MKEIAAVVEYRKQLLEMIKQELLKGHSITPALIGFTHAGLVPAAIPGLESQILKKGGDSPSSEVLAIMPLALDGISLFRILLNVLEESSQIAVKELLQLRVAAAEHHKETTEKSAIFDDVVNTICTINSISRKDIQARGMRWFLEKLNAFAAVFISEAWVTVSLDKNEPENKEHVTKLLESGLENAPGVTEAVVIQTETADNVHLVSIPILRDSTTKITGFGEITEIEDTSEPGTKVSGRFTSLLKPFKVPKNTTIH